MQLRSSRCSAQFFQVACKRRAHNGFGVVGRVDLVAVNLPWWGSAAGLGPRQTHAQKTTNAKSRKMRKTTARDAIKVPRRCGTSIPSIPMPQLCFLAAKRWSCGAEIRITTSAVVPKRLLSRHQYGD